MIKKKMKRMTAILLTGVLSVSAVSLVSAENEKVQVEGSVQEHQFMAYQIFSGTQAAGESEIGDIQWGSGIEGENFLKALLAVKDSAGKSVFADCSNAKDVAEVLETAAAENVNLFIKSALSYLVSAKGIKVVNGSEVPGTGYYLIQDVTEFAPGTEDTYYNASLLQLTNKDTFQIRQKTDHPEIYKKVKENTDVEDWVYQSETFSDFNDAADYNIGDTIPFSFYSKVPDMNAYEKYTYIIHDTMEKGLSFVDSSVVVSIGTTIISPKEYTVKTSGIGKETFQLQFADLKKLKAAQGSTILVTYKATLNKNAVIGNPGNTNKVYLEYSNRPDDCGTGTGKTPEDKVVVFTYELDTTKVDGNDPKLQLSGAEFVFYQERDGKKMYVITDENGKVAGWTANDADAEEQVKATLFVTKKDENFAVSGLDEGTYWLEEKKAPAGYNKLTEPVKIVITATTANSQDWDMTENALKALQIEVGEGADKTVEKESPTDGVVNAAITNHKGAKLPETGGIGTTIFYIAGGCLMILAVILGILKKKLWIKTEKQH